MPELDKLAAALTQDIVDAIGKTLAAAMETAVRNGADSRSMPDEYVTTAAWLSGATVETQQPEQPTPENFIIRMVEQKVVDLRRMRTELEDLIARL